MNSMTKTLWRTGAPILALCLQACTADPSGSLAADSSGESAGVATAEDSKADAVTPKRGTATRTAIVRAIHSDFLDGELHQQRNEIVISLFRVDKGHAFVDARAQKVGGGDLDWTNSDYADALSEGVFSGPFLQAYLEEQADGRWKVIEHVIGPTDVWWWGLWERHPEAPCDIFPSGSEAACAAVPGNGG